MPGEKELRPALSHGYPAEMISQAPAARANGGQRRRRGFRTAQLQIVLARPGSANGAVVAPLLTSAGCVGVVSAEIRGGGETSESVQAIGGHLRGPTGDGRPGAGRGATAAGQTPGNRHERHVSFGSL